MKKMEVCQQFALDRKSAQSVKYKLKWMNKNLNANQAINNENISFISINLFEWF